MKIFWVLRIIRCLYYNAGISLFDSNLIHVDRIYPRNLLLTSRQPLRDYYETGSDLN